MFRFVVALVALTTKMGYCVTWQEANCVQLGGNGEIMDCSDSKTGGSLSWIPTGIPLSTTHLWLSNNKIESISANTLAGMVQLKYLYLDGNIINAIEPGAFDDLISLTYLLCDNNALTDIPSGLFVQLRNLQALDLRSNSIEKLDGAVFSSLAQVSYLNLFGNSIKDIGCGTFNSFKNLGYLNMGENPSHCQIDKDSFMLSCTCSGGASTGSMGYCSTTKLSCALGQPQVGTTESPFPDFPTIAAAVETERATMKATSTAPYVDTADAAAADEATGTSGGGAGTSAIIIACAVGTVVMVAAAIGIAFKRQEYSFNHGDTSTLLTGSINGDGPAGVGARGGRFADTHGAEEGGLQWDDNQSTWKAQQDADCQSESDQSTHTSIANKFMNYATGKWKSTRMFNSASKSSLPRSMASSSSMPRYKSSSSMPKFDAETTPQLE